MDVGILIIGSLYWRQGERENWRRERLLVGESLSDVVIETPIRYGRRSQSGTYTMVFSPSAPMGRGRAVRCRSAAYSTDDLIDEACHLWKAESPRAMFGSISASWGCVSILVNPTSQIAPQILAEWARFIRQQSHHGNIPQTPSEGALVGGDGLLQLQWPQIVNERGIPARFDLLLATATHPVFEGTPPAYPSPRRIAAAWGQGNEDSVECFRRNREHGIVTFEDGSILHELRASYPAKAIGIA